MQFYGKVIVIKRNGMDGAHFPLTTTCCLFGRDQDCDVRIQLPAVDTKQCEIDIDDKGHAFIKNVSTTSATIINDKVLSNSLTALSHGDIITIVDRKFRFEFPIDSRFYPKSPKTKSPKTPKDVNTPKTNDGEKDTKLVRCSSPVSPLSPRTDNVPQSSKSPQSAKKNTVGEPMSASEVSATHKTPVSHSSGSLKGVSPDFLLGMSPTTFYTSVTPRAVNSLSDSQQEKINPLPGASSTTTPEGAVSQSSKSAAVNSRQRSPGSPYSKAPANLRKSITDLRRRSMPVFETDEDSTQFPANQEDVPVPVQAGIKRKASDFGLLNAKRKRVSFGPNLSPEHFDKSLPPKTPVKKGATPGRIRPQERKSLLKMKSQRGKSASPNGQTPSKRASPLKTPVKAYPQVENMEASSLSPTMEIAASEQVQSPRSKPQDTSLSLRSTPKATPERKNMSEKSPSKNSPQSTLTNTPKGNFATSVFPDQPAYSSPTGSVHIPPISSPKIKSPASILPISSQSPHKVLSPALQTDAVQISVTPRRSSSSHQMSATPQFGVSTSSKRSVSSDKMSASPRPRLSTTPRRSLSSPRSLSSHEKSVTPRTGVSTTPRRSSSYHQMSATPQLGMSSSSRRSVSTDKMSASPRPRLSTTPRRSLSSPRLLSSHDKSVTPRTGVSTTPRRSSSSHQRSVTPRSGMSTTLRRSSSSHKKSATPRSGSSHRISPSPRLSFSSQQISPRSKENFAIENLSPLVPSHEQDEQTPLRAVTTKINSSTSANVLYSPNLQTLSPELFSQVNSKTAGNKSVGDKKVSPKIKEAKSPSLVAEKVATPNNRKRVSKTVKQKRPRSLEISPTALQRIMKTPKEKRVSISTFSPTGIRNLVKTPRIKRAIEIVSTPSGLRRLLKTPKPKQKLEASLIGIKEIMKTPKTSADVSFSGVSAMLSTPAHSKQDARSIDLNVNNATPLPKNLLKPFDTPRPIFSDKRNRSPKIFFDEIQPTKSLVPKNLISTKSPSIETKSSPMQLIQQPGKCSVGRPPSTKKMLAKVATPAEKIISPPQDFNKVAALRAIHGHTTTPKVASLKMGTPKSIIKQAAKSAKKTPLKKTWSDIVKSGVQKPAAVKALPLPARATIAKRKSPSFKTIKRIPKTPRTIARALAPTTGHADSPATILVGKKILSRMLTPKLLPRKGRKQSLSKASRKSAGNTSFTGLAEMFVEPTEADLSESNLYADIPDTPNGPNEMFVSPLSNRKHSLGMRKSTNLVGIRELFMQKEQQESDFTGVKELFASSSTTSTGCPSGLKRLMKTPKNIAKTVSPKGLVRLLTTPKTKSLLVSPTGIDLLFKSPVNIETSSQVEKLALEQAQVSPKSQANKAGSKRRGDSIKKPFAKKICLSSTQVIAHAIIYENAPVISTQNQVQIVKSPSSSQKTGKGRPQKLQMIEPVPFDTTVSHVIDGKTTSPLKTVSQGRPCKRQNIEAAGGQISSSPSKSAGRGRPRKLLVLKSVPVKETSDVLDGKISPLPSTVSTQDLQDKEQINATVLSPIKAAGRGRPRKLQVLKSVPVKETLDGKISPLPPTVSTRELQDNEQVSVTVLSPFKAAGRGRPRKLQVLKSVPVEETLDEKISPLAPTVSTRELQDKEQVSVAVLSPFKTTGKGRRGKVHVIESSAKLDEVIPLFTDGQADSLLPKGGGRSRSHKQVSVEEIADVKNGQIPSSPPKVATQEVHNKEETVAAILSPPRGRRGRMQLMKSSPLNKIISLSSAVETVSSPAKVTGSRRGKSVAFVAVPSPIKTTGRVRRGQVQSVKSPVKKTGRGRQSKVGVFGTDPLPSKATGRIRKKEIQIIEPTSVEETIAHIVNEKAVRSSSKSNVRDKRDQVQVVGSSPLSKIIPSSPAKTGRVRRGKVMIAETVPSPPKVNAPGRVDILKAELPPKTTGRGRKVKVLTTEAAVVEKTATITVSEKTISSPPKANVRGRRGRVQKIKSPLNKIIPLLPVVSPDKLADRDRQGKVMFAEAVSSAQSKLDEVNVLETTELPPKTTGRGRPSKADILKTTSSPKPKRQGSRAKTQLIISPLKKIVAAAVEKTVLSPAKIASRGRSSKKNNMKLAESSTSVKKQGSIKSPALSYASKKGASSEVEPIFSPAKSRAVRRGGHLVTSKLSHEDDFVSLESVADKQIRGRKRKMEVAAIPTPEKRVKVDSPVQISQVKPGTAQRGKTVQLSAVKGPSPVKNSSMGVRGRVKKAIDVKTASPVKSRRGPLKKKRDAEASPVMKKQGRAKAAVHSPKPVSVASKKMSKGPKTNSNKRVASAKPSVATRQRK